MLCARSLVCWSDDFSVLFLYITATPVWYDDNSGRLRFSLHNAPRSGLYTYLVANDPRGCRKSFPLERAPTSIAFKKAKPMNAAAICNESAPYLYMEKGGRFNECQFGSFGR